MCWINRKSLYVNIVICKWNLFIFKINSKNHVFVIIVMFDVDQYFLRNISFITVIRMFENSDNKQNGESAIINIIIRIIKFYLF